MSNVACCKTLHILACSERVSGIWGQAGAVHVSDCFRCSISFPFDHFTVVGRRPLVLVQLCQVHLGDLWTGVKLTEPVLIFSSTQILPNLAKDICRYQNYTTDKMSLIDCSDGCSGFLHRSRKSEWKQRSDTWLTWTLTFRHHWVQCLRSVALCLPLTVKQPFFHWSQWRLNLESEKEPGTLN